METFKDYSRYLTIPYKVRGRDFDGVDCWGLVRLFLLNEFGIEIDNYLQYSVKNLEEVKQVAKEEKKKWIKVEIPQPGDVAEIRTFESDFHVGVIAHPGYLLHIYNERFSEMSKVGSPLLKRAIKDYWRHRGVQ